ncbi:MAG: hypothetical protein LBD29_00720 [Treponema sp.]|jgi:hypothetical protein|nr:hypothetical protein [Treponema sp.]
MNDAPMVQQFFKRRDGFYRFGYRVRQQPTANSQQPTANSQQPTANSQQPTANSQQPTANSQQHYIGLFQVCQESISEIRLFLLFIPPFRILEKRMSGEALTSEAAARYLSAG